MGESKIVVRPSPPSSTVDIRYLVIAIALVLGLVLFCTFATGLLGVFFYAAGGTP